MDAPTLKTAAVAAAVIIVGMGCAHGHERAEATQATPLVIRAFDIGYGDAVLVSAGEQHLLFDVGPADAGPKLVSKLRALGVEHLALLVLSHPHPDHVEGLEALLGSGIGVDRAVHNPADGWHEVPGFSELKSRVPTTAAALGDSPLQLGSVRVSFLHPDARPQSDPNNLSLVVLLEGEGGAALFPGDLVDLDLQRALCPRLPQRLAVLKAPHHGDHVAECLAARTDLLLISVGENPWGVPRAETLSSFADRLRRTDLEGDVVVTLSGQ